MPSIFRYKGYIVYFWSNENGEPIHVHVSKGSSTSNATKFWITSSGGTILVNTSRYPSKDMNKLSKEIIAHTPFITNMWDSIFGGHTYIC